MNKNIKIVVEVYEKNIGILTSSVLDDIKCFLNNGLETNIIIDAIRKSASASKPNWGYAKAVIKSIIAAKKSTITAKDYKIGDVPW